MQLRRSEGHQERHSLDPARQNAISNLIVVIVAQMCATSTVIGIEYVTTKVPTATSNRFNSINRLCHFSAFFSVRRRSLLLGSSAKKVSSNRRNSSASGGTISNFFPIPLANAAIIFGLAFIRRSLLSDSGASSKRFKYLWARAHRRHSKPGHSILLLR